MSNPSEPDLPRLSHLLMDGWSRRSFLRRAGLAGAAVAAGSCTQTDTGDDRAASSVDSATAAQQGPINSNSRSDTALTIPGSPSSMTGAVPTPDSIPYRRYDPALPPVSAERTVRLNWRATEVPVRISPDVVVAAWTFEDDVPGPIVHVRQGDTIEFTLTNEGVMPHSMDFHAAQLNPAEAFRSVPQGESVSFTFQPRHAGAFLYHCGTGPVLMHIGTGMFGAIIVDPAEPLPAANEFVLVQSEHYVSDGERGISVYDYSKMLRGSPDYVAFNGRPDQYIREPLRVAVGERVRFYVISAGPSHPCNFHVVGEQFETVYLGSPPVSAIQGVQTFGVPPGGGMIFEFVADVAGEFPFVNHGFGHGQKGAIGFLIVE